MMAISLVIASRNRGPQLNRCLSYVNELRTSVSWELIVVDNGSTDSTPEILREFQRSASFPVTVVAEPSPGLGRAHNRGWQLAKGDIVAFTDDDCYVLPDFLDQAVAVFADPRIGYCGGRIELYDMSDHPIATLRYSEPQLFPPRSYMAPGTIQGANMMFRGRTLEDIGGFDDGLGPGTPFNCEDVDACARASFSGWWGAYMPGPTVLHAHGRKAADVPGLWRSYAIGRGAYAAKFILWRDTRRCHVRYWLWQLPERLIRRGHRRECLHEIQGAIWYCCHRARALCGIR